MLVYGKGTRPLGTPLLGDVENQTVLAVNWLAERDAWWELGPAVRF